MRARTLSSAKAAGVIAPLRPHLGPLLLWTVLWSLFFFTLLAGAAHLPSSDFSGQFHATALFQAQEIGAGRLPVWSPGSYGGYPFAADPQTAVFYPLRWLTILLSLPWGLSLYALEVEALAHVWLAGAFSYGLAFVLTRRRAAALLAAVAFGLGGYTTSYPLLQLAVLETITWLPLILLLLRHGVSARHPRPWLVVAGLALAMAITAGHPQTFLHVAYLAAAYLLFLGRRAGWSWRALAGRGLLVFLVAVGAAAATWLPALRLALHSTRSDAGYAFVAGGQPLLNDLQVLLPGLLALWSPEYVGVAPLALAFFAWWGRDDAHPERAAEIHFWAAVALVAGWLALGDAGILFQLAYHVVPGFSLFRQQERWMSIANFSLVLLAAQGAALWLQVEAPRRQRLLRQTLAVLGLVLFFAGLFILVAPQLDRAEAGTIWLRQAAILGAVALLLAGARTRRRLALLLGILVGDLFLAGYGSLGRPGQPPSVFWPQPAWMQTLQAEIKPLARVDTRNLFHANVGEVYGLEDVHGISPLKLQFVEAFAQLPQERRWRLLGVSHVTSYGPPEAPAEAVMAIEESVVPGQEIVGGLLYRLPDPLPRAWMSYRPLPVASEEEALQRLAAPDFRPERDVMLHGDVPGQETITPPPVPPEVSVRRLRPNALRVEVESAAPGLLVIGEWRYPGWRATLDGKSAPLYAADYALQALRVPAGQHTVELRFVPLDVIAGMAISILTLLFSLLLLRYRRVTPLPGAGNRRAWPRPALPRIALRSRPFLCRHARQILLLLLLLAFALRLANLGYQELRGDEAFSVGFAQLPLQEVAPALVAAGDPHPPLHYLLLSVWLHGIGDGEFVLRYPSVLLSLLLLPLLFLLGVRLRDRSLGALMVALAAVSQSLLWLAQDVRNQYLLVMLFTTAATLLLARAAERRGWRPWLGYALLAALAMYSHTYGVFALVAHGLYLAVVPGRRRALLPWAGAGLVALLLFAPWLFTAAGWRGQLYEPAPRELATFLTGLGRELAAGPAFPPGPGRWLWLLALFFCLVGWHALWRRPGWAALLGGWLGGATLGIFLVALRRATLNNFYIAVAAPAWWALVATGVLSLWQEGPRAGRPPSQRLLALLGVLALVVAAAVSLGRYYVDPVTYGRANGLRQATRYVTAHLQEGDLFLFHFPDPALNYYLRHSEVPRNLQPAGATATGEATEEALQQLAATYERIWFVPQSGSNWDPENVVPRWLDYHLLLEEEQVFLKTRLQAYRPLHAVNTILTPLQAQLPERLRLEGVWITVDGKPVDPAAVPVSLAPGAEVNVSLVWRALAEIPDGYTVFVHLLDEQGTLIAQHDGVPAHGTRPTTSWRPGERILDEHAFVVPPGAAGRARLVAGLYDTETLTRQIFANGQEVVPLAEGQVAAPAAK